MYHDSVFILGNTHTWVNGCRTIRAYHWLYNGVQNEITVHLNLLEASRPTFNIATIKIAIDNVVRIHVKLLLVSKLFHVSFDNIGAIIYCAV